MMPTLSLEPTLHSKPASPMPANRIPLRENPALKAQPALKKPTYADLQACLQLLEKFHVQGYLNDTEKQYQTLKIQLKHLQLMSQEKQSHLLNAEDFKKYTELHTLLSQVTLDAKLPSTAKPSPPKATEASNDAFKPSNKIKKNEPLRTTAHTDYWHMYYAYPLTEPHTTWKKRIPFANTALEGVKSLYNKTSSLFSQLPIRALNRLFPLP